MLVFDNAEPNIGTLISMCVIGQFITLPNHAPEALGHWFSTTYYVDTDRVGCKAKYHSHTGILIHVNCVPIIGFSI